MNITAPVPPLHRQQKVTGIENVTLAFPCVKSKPRVLADVENLVRPPSANINPKEAAERQRRNAEKLSRGYSVVASHRLAEKENKSVSSFKSDKSSFKAPLNPQPKRNEERRLFKSSSASSLLPLIEPAVSYPKEEETKAASSVDLEELSNLVIDEDSNNEDEFAVGIYAKAVFKYLRSLEIAQSVRRKYLTKQHVMTGSMRAVLVDWIFEVQYSFSLLQDTTQMAVGLLDRFMQETPRVSKEDLQLIAVTCILIASKYEEMYPPSVDDLVLVCAHACSKGQILRSEIRILKTLEFGLGRAPPITFLRRYCRIASCSPLVYSFGKYFVDIALVDYNLCHIPPSLLAAAALCLALFVTSKSKECSSLLWSPSLSVYSGYSYSNIFPNVVQLAKLVVSAPTLKQKSVRQYYASTKKVQCVSVRPEVSSQKLVLLAATAVTSI